MTNTQACPLCDSPATFTQSNQSKHFKCPVCNEFWIDPFSEDYLAEMVEVTRTERRAEMSKSASLKIPGHNFILRESSHEERGGSGHGVARTTMIFGWFKHYGVTIVRSMHQN